MSAPLAPTGKARTVTLVLENGVRWTMTAQDIGDVKGVGVVRAEVGEAFDLGPGLAWGPACEPMEDKP